MDITMCSNDNCELKEGCLRFIAIPNEYCQSRLYDPENNCVDKGHKLFIDTVDQPLNNSSRKE